MHYLHNLFPLYINKTVMFADDEKVIISYLHKNELSLEVNKTSFKIEQRLTHNNKYYINKTILISLKNLYEI